MYRKKSKGWLKHYDFILFDLVCVQVAFILAYVLSGNGPHPYERMLYRNMAVFLELSDIVVIFFFGTLKNVLKRGHYRNFMITVQHTMILGALAVAYLFALKRGADYSRMAQGLFLVIYFIISYAVREMWVWHIRKKGGQEGDCALLVVTISEQAEDTLARVSENSYGRYRVCGVVCLDRDATGETLHGIPVVANAESLVDFVCKEWIDEVLFVLPRKEPYPEALMENLSQTGVTIHYNLAEVSGVSGKRQLVERVCGYTVLTVGMNYMTLREAFAKRFLDICGGLAGCILTAVIGIVIGPIIYFQSPGPMFFSQIRIGRNGKRFRMYKFRSMYMDAEERKKELMELNRVEDGMMFKLDFDPRVIGNQVLPDGTHKTGIGNFIRTTSLDEFPQFFNVLKGDMSLVGTRPPTPDEWEKYELHHRARLSIKPGITGLWQTSGRSSITDFEEVVRLDKEYIENWSIGLDLRILLKTVSIVVKRDGAA